MAQDLHGRIFISDNLPVLRRIDDDSVDLIYLDPPFNSGKNYEAPVGSRKAKVEFKDAWTLDDTEQIWLDTMQATAPDVWYMIRAAEHVHSNAMAGYLAYMWVRLRECARILKRSGSIYLHCDQTANSYLRMLMDSAFGRAAFRNEIVWCYTGPANVRRQYPRKHDTILFYAGPDAAFNRDAVRVGYAAATIARGQYAGDLGHGEGAGRDTTRGKVPEDWWTKFPAGGGMSPQERTGWPTQKPLALLERVIKASSKPGDLVLDPFCGCATACVAAERLGRRWCGIDVSTQAVDIMRQRLLKVRRDREESGQPELPLTELRTTSARQLPERTDRPAAAFSPNIRERLYREQGGDCAGCGRDLPFDILELDHIVPRARGGEDRDDNAQLLCPTCNRIKGARDQSYLDMRLRERAKKARLASTEDPAA